MYSCVPELFLWNVLTDLNNLLLCLVIHLLHRACILNIIIIIQILCLLHLILLQTRIILISFNLIHGNIIMNHLLHHLLQIPLTINFMTLNHYLFKYYSNSYKHLQIIMLLLIHCIINNKLISMVISFLRRVI